MIFDPKGFIFTDNFEANFIRLANDFYISEPGQEGVTHEQIVEMDKLGEKIEKMRLVNPLQIDAGLIFMDGRMIRIGSESAVLDLPVTKSAREETLKRLKSKNPSFSVKELSEE